MKTFKHVLVATDFSEHADHAADVAAALAAEQDAKLTVVHVVHLPEYAYAERTAAALDDLVPKAQDALDQAVARLEKRAPRVEGVLAQGVAWEAIVRIAKECAVDLVVTGTHGRRGVPHMLLGSVAEKVVRASPAPVLTIPLAATGAAGPA
jgi:nucleotide-binding universal stress UspA family protein